MSLRGQVRQRVGDAIGWCGLSCLVQREGAITMIIDCHVHSAIGDDPQAILQGMDAAGIDKIVLFSAPPLQEGRAPIPTREASLDLARIAAQALDRIIPFTWVEPTLPDAVDELDYAVHELGFRGVKMIPNHWSPTDEAVFPVYEKIQELGLPVICHSGILFGNQDSSRFCRPVLYEAFIHFPGIRFALAHIGWPWVDECLAVAGRFRYEAQRTGTPCQMWVDTCPGTPPIWRPEALQKAFAYLGDEMLLWGSDATGSRIARAGETLATDRRILRSILGANAEAERRWFGENAQRFLGL
jgi:predicted TIM-barrel fold metal-dependent hydrolase